MPLRAALVLSLLTSTVLLASGGPGLAASVSDPSVSVSGGVTLTGRGFGHGIGMSQYGAQGRALKGGTAAGILANYYPGTKIAQGSGDIKVWITADNDSDTVVLAKKGLQLADYGAGKAYTLPSIGAVAWKLYASGGKFKVSYQKNGWHPYSPGGKSTLSGYGEFRSTSFAVTLRTPAGDRSYRGAVQLRPSPSVATPYKTINRTGLESYVRGVVASEMPSTWRREALKAQAIAARTFVLHEKGENDGPSDTFHVDDTTSSQVYRGMAAETAATDAAVKLTAGSILKYGSAIALTQFSASNGGFSAAGSAPYLVARADTFEQYAKAPGPWTYSPSQTTLQTKLSALAKSGYGTTIGTLKSIQVLTREGHGIQWGGRVLSVKLHGDKADVTVTGAQFRTALSLRSTWFTVS